MLRIFPDMFEPLFCGSEKIPHNSRQISRVLGWRTQWVHLSLYDLCANTTRELTEFVSGLTEFAQKLSEFSGLRNSTLETLDGRNRAIVIAESLARVIAAIRIASVRWLSYLPPKNTEFGPRRPCVRCAAVRIARLAFVGVAFVPRGTAEWLARVDRVRWLAIPEGPTIKKFNLARIFNILNPEGPTIKKLWSRSKFSISIEIFDLARNFNLDVSISPQKIGPRWVARSKISFSIEIYNLDRNLVFFWSLGPLGTQHFFTPVFCLLWGPPNPKNLLRLFFASKIILFSEVIFKDPPKHTLENKLKNNLARLFLFFEVIFASRGYFWKIASKDS